MNKCIKFSKIESHSLANINEIEIDTQTPFMHSGKSLTKSFHPKMCTLSHKKTRSQTKMTFEFNKNKENY